MRLRKPNRRWNLPTKRAHRRRRRPWFAVPLSVLASLGRVVCVPFRPLRRLRMRRVIRAAAITTMVVGVLGIAALVLAVAWVSRTLPDPDNISTRRVAESTRIYDRTGETILYEVFSGERRTFVHLEKIPTYVKWATIVVEDKNFYTHNGFDLKGIFRAVIVNTIQRRRAQGGSTITQQFIKNAVLTHEKTYARKLKEFIIAFEVERRFSKDQILEMYLNEINYGGPNHGVESASMRYFGKPVAEASIAEAAILAALPKAPSYYSPYGNHRDELIERQQFILARMRDEGYITNDEYEQAKMEALVFTARDEHILAPHFSLWVRELLAEQYGDQRLIEDGLRVTTSLDLPKQRIAEEVITDLVPNNAKEWNASNAALVAIDPKTGQILSMVGSRDYFDPAIDGNVNVALRPRQPGSSFKPIVYAAAFEKGYTPDTLLFDVETVFPTDVEGEYIPKNYDKKEYGVVTIRKALQGSLNIPAVKTMYLTGIGRVLDFAERLGYTTLHDRSRFGLSLVLGGGEVTLLEHTATYATFARSGIAHPPVAILKVEDREGNVLYEWKENPGTRVFDEHVGQLLNDVLTDNAARAYIFGTQNSLTLPDRLVAAKTGTTNDFRDAWTMGYTPSLAVGVWGGNNDNTPMREGGGGSRVASTIWNAFMRKVLTGTPVETFKKPDPEVIDKPVLRGEGMGDMTVTIDRISGKRATELTPLDLREERTYRVLKPILYFLEKDNPRGPQPTDPERDPYYSFWLQSIENWATRNGIVEVLPPTEADDIHVPENIPAVAWAAPLSGTVLARGDSVTLSVTANAPRGVAHVEYFVDTLRIGEASGTPFALTWLLGANLTPGNHLLRARAYDDAENVGESTISIEIR